MGFMTFLNSFYRNDQMSLLKQLHPSGHPKKSMIKLQTTVNICISPPNKIFYYFLSNHSTSKPERLFSSSIAHNGRPRKVIVRNHAFAPMIVQELSIISHQYFRIVNIIASYYITLQFYPTFQNGLSLPQPCHICASAFSSQWDSTTKANDTAYP